MRAALIRLTLALASLAALASCAQEREAELREQGLWFDDEDEIIPDEDEMQAEFDPEADKGKD